MSARKFLVMTFPPLSTLAFCSVLLASGIAAAAPAQPALPPVQADASDLTTIVAVVNGDVISRSDVENRCRLFAMSTGLPVTREVLDHLKPQVTRELIDEKLRLQEIQHRKIVVADSEIAAAIKTVEARNNLPPGTLQHRLAADGVAMRTLIDQMRVQIGWGRVLRQQLGNQATATEADIAEQERLIKAQSGQPEYRVGQIFVPIDDAAHEAEARSFAETVIQQLRNGAPFAVAAAQFSQSQTALEGGDLGWVQPIQLDPEVAKVVADMPPGAISNPIRVAGGFAIVTLRAKRQIGNDPATILRLRQAFLPFSAPLDPQNPTEQQRQQLEHAKQIAASVHSCDEMEAANKALGMVHPSDPGDVRLENVNPPQFRAMLTDLPAGKSSQPLVAKDGIALVIICSRETKNMATPVKADLASRLVDDRAELASRQLMRDLHRRAVIDLRTGGA